MQLHCLVSKIMFLMGSLLLLVGCQHETLYHSFQSTNLERWKEKDTLFFTPILRDSSLRLSDVYIEVKHTVDYAYTDLHLRILTLKNDSLLQTDSLAIPLILKKGKWLGKGNAAYRQYRFFFYKRTLQSLNGSSLGILPILPKDGESLKGIASIGLFIQK